MADVKIEIVGAKECVLQSVKFYNMNTLKGSAKSNYQKFVKDLINQFYLDPKNPNINTNGYIQDGKFDILHKCGKTGKLMPVYENSVDAVFLYACMLGNHALQHTRFPSPKRPIETLDELKCLKWGSWDPDMILVSDRIAQRRNHSSKHLGDAKMIPPYTVLLDYIGSQKSVIKKWGQVIKYDMHIYDNRHKEGVNDNKKGGPNLSVFDPAGIYVNGR